MMLKNNHLKFDESAARCYFVKIRPSMFRATKKSFLSVLLLAPSAMLYSQEEPPDTTPPPIVAVAQAPSLIQAVAFGDFPTAIDILKNFPACANEKSTSPFALPESEPKNLRFLAKSDTALTPMHIAAARGADAG